jgi:phosphotransferase system, enzyme I, PtsP
MGKKGIVELLDRIERKAGLFEDSSDLDDFLGEAVDLARVHTGSAATAIFLYDSATGHLVYKAGKIMDSIAKPESIRFTLDENIAGQAFREGRVLHENRQRPTADHPYRSTIAIPIHHGPENIGVLIFAHHDLSYYEREDEGSLRALAAQFGSVLVSASLLLRSEEHPGAPPSIIAGKTASEGIAVGTALQFEAELEDISSAEEVVTVSEDELARFDQSLELTIRQLENLENDKASPAHDMAALIFSSYILMLNDDSLTGKMRQLIIGGHGAVSAIRRVVAEYTRIFSKMKETRLAEKAQDVRDIGYRLVRNLGGPQDDGVDYRGRIAIARHIYPSDLIRLAVQRISGIVLMGSGVTAHIAILARTLDLPVLITHDSTIADILPDSLIVLDATNGRLHTRPDEELLKSYRTRAGRIRTRRAPGAYTFKGRTKDGVSVSVSANINLFSDAETASKEGAEGIGLYRSEFPFIIKNDFLTEEQQFQIYRRIIMTMPGRPVLLRTADIGGDKLMEGRGTDEQNPFLGVRGIRFSLANREIFREQLRAMLRAGEGADIGIMLPMVSSVEEVVEAKAEIAVCREQLRDEGTPFNESPKIGAMVELPSAAISVIDLAEETDFLSIGTNDLVMYLLAVDRTNEKLSHLYQSYHPTVLRTLSRIAKDSGQLLTELSVCGDSASDPLIIPFLIGIGIRKLSVSPQKVERVKRYIAHFSVAETKTIASEMLQARRTEEMERYLGGLRERYPVEILGNEFVDP